MTWEARKRRYLRLGLCHRCAAQAAWGHQLGFSQSKPPCPDCQPIVDTFPVRKPNNWHASSPHRGAKFSPPLRPENGSGGHWAANE